MNKLMIASLFSLAIPALPALADGDDNGPAAACPTNLPAALAPAADQRLRFYRPATGAQVYMCTASASGVAGWVFVAPQANLYNDDNDLVGTHFIGPVWQGNDGSSVKAAKVAAATVDVTAVPWLLLKSVGNTGPGHFAEISTVQRLNTTGGKAPDASLCTLATLNTIKQVAYTADYFFYDTHAAGPDGNAQCR